MSVPIEKLLEKTGGSVYKLVTVAALRAQEISEGSPALTETDPKKKPSLVALDEIVAGQVAFRPKKKEK
ncbi:MAG: DNA-directed RNA polymerase subunit omega [Candidatus Omnitrophica bacterium]|nr:DNA-directed RNA polymerase subunit omega [Candidatus Omnitrophota bacterium]